MLGKFSFICQWKRYFVSGFHALPWRVPDVKLPVHWLLLKMPGRDSIENYEFMFVSYHLCVVRIPFSTERMWKDLILKRRWQKIIEKLPYCKEWIYQWLKYTINSLLFLLFFLSHQKPHTFLHTQNVSVCFFDCPLSIWVTITPLTIFMDFNKDCNAAIICIE